MSKTASTTALRQVLTNLRTPGPTSPTQVRGSLSAVHRGLAFEKRSLRLLQSCLSMSLHHVGGKSDGGVDLQGWWWVPTSASISSSKAIGGHGEEEGGWSLPRRRIRVFAQCKAEKKKLGPNYVRELEGVLYRHRHRSQPVPTPSDATTSSSAHVQGFEIPIVGVLISQSPFTKSAVLHATSSVMPFLLLHIPPHPSGDHEHEQEQEAAQDAEVGSMVFNQALASRSGPLGGEVEARWEWSAETRQGRPGLWWRGRRIPSWVPEVDRGDTSISALSEQDGWKDEEL
ncbi:hypothetical protein EIP91_004562 [Steccherinum ochraceum]|uniref:Required for respiratory growth protein 7, mitochondrial n=1 Tax=Steccherinum ochraceum TaxID=92696 RepID=A0A4R0R8K7_9APHY|nr:hypothetical protein EIP91_004562 [Steccherinum ochraceum]